MALIGNRITRVTLEAVISGYERSVRTAATVTDDLRAKAERFSKGKYDAKVGVDTAKARTDLSALERQLAEYARSSSEQRVNINTDEARARLDAIQARLVKFGTSVTDARVALNGDAEAQSSISRIEASLLALGNRTAKPEIDLRGVAAAEAQIGVLEAQLAALSHDTASPNVRLRGSATAVSSGGGLLRDSILALGPGIVPIAAAGTAAIAGFGSALLAAGGAAGALGLAVGGQVAEMKKQQQAITSAEKSLAGMTKGTQAYHDKLAQLNAMQAAFNQQFGPAAAALGRLETAWHGFLSGTSGTSDSLIAKALNIAATMLPKLQGLVEAAGGSVEHLLSDLARFARGPEAGAMLAFFAREGPAAIETFGSILGNVGKGFVSLLMAFSPFARGMMAGLDGMSQSFARWAANLGSSQGFHSFMAYVASEGPKVLALLAAFGKALIAVSVAAGPIGGVVVSALTQFLNVVTEIAKSPLGPTIFTAAAAFGVLNRALAVTTGMGLVGFFKNIGNGAQQMSVKAAAGKAGLIGLGVGLEILASHVDDSNTAVKGLLDVAGGAAIGAAFGPWGAVIGGAAGLLQAFTQHSQSATAAQAALQAQVQKVVDTLNNETGATSNSTIPALIKSFADTGLDKVAASLGISINKVVAAVLAGSKGFGAFDDGAAKAQAQLDALGKKYAQTAGTFRQGADTGTLTAARDDTQVKALQARVSAYKALSDAVASYGAAIQAQHDKILAENILSGQYYGATAEATGTVRRMGSAIDDLGQSAYRVADPIKAAADAAQQMARADNAAYVAAMKLNNQAIGRIGAWDSYNQALADAAKQAKASGDAWGKNTDKGRAARETLAGIAAAAQKVAGTMKKGSYEQTVFMDNARASLIKTAVSFGATRRQAQAFADTVERIPASRSTKVILEDQAAIAGLKAIKQFEDSLYDKTITITTVQRHVLQELTQQGGGPGGINGATGGIIRGPGSGTSDSIPVHVSNGEGILREQVMRQQGPSRFHALNSGRADIVPRQGFAAGGRAGSPYRAPAPATREWGPMGGYMLPPQVHVSANGEWSSVTAELRALRAEVAALRGGRQHVIVDNAPEMAEGVQRMAQGVVNNQANWAAANAAGR